MKLNQGIAFKGAVVVTGSTADQKLLQQKIGKKVTLAVSKEIEPGFNNVRLYATGKDINLVTQVENSRIFLSQSQERAYQLCSEHAAWGRWNIPSVEKVLQKEVKPLLIKIKKVDAKNVLKAIERNSFDFDKLEFKTIAKFIIGITSKLSR